MKSRKTKSIPGFTEPTNAELEILQVLWKYGPSTVRFVNEKLNEHKPVKYTSTLKQMQIMVDKSILDRDVSKMTHIYHILEEEEKTKSFLLNRFVDRIYSGSAGKLIMQLLGDDKASKEDIEKIKKMLDEMESGTQE